MTQYAPGESEFHDVIKFRLKFRECNAFDLLNYVLRNDIRTPLELKEKLAELIKAENDLLSDDEQIADEALKIDDNPRTFVVVKEKHEDYLKTYSKWLEITKELFKV